MSVTILDVVAAARAREVSLVGEIVGYLVLGAVERLGTARQLGLEEMTLSEDGLLASRVAEDRGSRVGPRELLAVLLAAATSAPPALRAAARPGDVGAFVSEIEAALIPLNRAAGKRALARLARETARALALGRVEHGGTRDWVASVLQSSESSPAVASRGDTSRTPVHDTACDAPVAPSSVETVERDDDSFSPELVFEVDLASPFVAVREEDSYAPAEAFLIEEPSLPGAAPRSTDPEAARAATTSAERRETASSSVAPAVETRPDLPRVRHRPSTTPVLGSLAVDARSRLPGPIEYVGPDSTDPMPVVFEDEPQDVSPAATDVAPASPVDVAPASPADVAPASPPNVAQPPPSPPIVRTPAGPSVVLKPRSFRPIFSSETPQSIARPRSTVSDLAARFSVPDGADHGALGRELKTMAGLGPTPPPPGAASFTPPPVVSLDEREEVAVKPVAGARSRAGAFAAMGAFLVLAFGVGKARFVPGAAPPDAPAETAAARPDEAVPSDACRAVLVVENAPEGATVKARLASGEMLAAVGPSSTFSDLPCGQALDVLVVDDALPGWHKIEVSADDLTARQGSPSPHRTVDARAVSRSR